MVTRLRVPGSYNLSESKWDSLSEIKLARIGRPGYEIFVVESQYVLDADVVIWDRSCCDMQGL